jgi:hypothetical protein
MKNETTLCAKLRHREYRDSLVRNGDYWIIKIRELIGYEQRRICGEIEENHISSSYKIIFGSRSNSILFADVHF